MWYEIRVEGALDQAWSNWFNGMVVTTKARQDGGSLTTLAGRVRDQAALRGILNKLWDLNLALVSVTCREVTEDSDDTDLYVTFG